jgi:quercetin dioxygenase-like cupin family protein
MTEASPTAAAEIVLPARPFDATLAFFVERLGFRVDAIFPADAPSTASISGHGLRLRLDAGVEGDAGMLRLVCSDPEAFAGVSRAPSGTRIEIVPLVRPIVMPKLVPGLVVSRAGDAGHWSLGRAGMRYRDLIPGRLGGRFIASHIVIPDGGKVPDYVHFHRVRFQAIYCRAGWVRVVYEDQGPDFVMRAGDCVLQPPEIRHRVLESSPGLEVIEIGCPALHETIADHALPLPNARRDPGRRFGGQLFVRHEAATATRGAWRFDGFEARDIGIAAATAGLADMRAIRPTTARRMPRASHDAELRFTFLLAGSAVLDAEGHGAHPLAAGDSFVVPAGLPYALEAIGGDSELLEVTVGRT